MSRLDMRPFDATSRAWAADLHRQHWASTVVISRGVAYVAHELAGVVAYHDGEPVGLATYHIVDDACELVTLDSLVEGIGAATALIDSVRERARQAGCRRLWLITSNDNTHALRFYQKRGFRLVALYPNAIEESRRLKPEIPLLGGDGIPIRDELELEIDLTVKSDQA